MDSSNKRKEMDENELLEPPRGRRLSDRHSTGPTKSYNVHDYYRGMDFNKKARVTPKNPPSQPQKKAATCTSENYCPYPDPQPAGLAPSSLPSQGPKLLWDTCLECVGILPKHPKANKCKIHEDGQKCHYCERNFKMCLKVRLKINGSQGLALRSSFFCLLSFSRPWLPTCQSSFETK